MPDVREKLVELLMQMKITCATIAAESLLGALLLRLRTTWSPMVSLLPRTQMSLPTA